MNPENLGIVGVWISPNLPADMRMREYLAAVAHEQSQQGVLRCGKFNLFAFYFNDSCIQIYP